MCNFICLCVSTCIENSFSVLRRLNKSRNHEPGPGFNRLNSVSLWSKTRIQSPTPYRSMTPQPVFRTGTPQITIVNSLFARSWATWCVQMSENRRSSSKAQSTCSGKERPLTQSDGFTAELFINGGDYLRHVFNL